MNVIETKDYCTIIGKSNNIESLVHLIEIQYSERIIFWNVVIQMTLEDFNKLEFKSNEPSYFEILLSNNRKGYFSITHFRATSDYFEIAGVGKPSITK